MSTTSNEQHSIFLESAGDNRIGIMAALRRRLSISPLEAKHLLDTPLTPIFAGSALQVADWVDDLQRLGAHVVVRPELPRTPLWMRRAPRDKPRAHHYELAHVAFVAFFQQNAPGLWLLLAEGAEAWVLRLWRRVGEALPVEERVEETGLSLVFERRGHLELAVITLPPPLAHAEAYFVALVRCPLQRAASSASFRYMTLERGLDMTSGGDQTYLCEWTVDKHVNHGNGPSPTIDAFVQAIAELESSKPAAAAGNPLVTADPSAIRSSQRTSFAQRHPENLAGPLPVEELPRPMIALKPITVVLILLAIAAFIIGFLSR